MNSGGNIWPLLGSLPSWGWATKLEVSVSEERAMALRAVNSCERLIASSIASLDLHLHRINGSLREVAVWLPRFIEDSI